MQLTDKEVELYDRQIRLWGVEAQQRMRSSRVLVVGLGALGAEVVKNLVLAGMNVTIHDAKAVDDADLGIQFFLSLADVGSSRAAASLPRIREMNVHVTVDELTKAPADLSDGELAAFRLVVHCGSCAVPDQVRASRRAAARWQPTCL